MKQTDIGQVNSAETTNLSPDERIEMAAAEMREVLGKYGCLIYLKATVGERPLFSIICVEDDMTPPPRLH